MDKPRITKEITPWLSEKERIWARVSMAAIANLAEALALERQKTLQLRDQLRKMSQARKEGT